MTLPARLSRWAAPLVLALAFLSLPHAGGGKFFDAGHGAAGEPGPPPPAEHRDLFRIYTFLDLAECLEEFRDREYFEAMYRQAHIEGTARYQFMVGLLYHHGIGVEKNPERAAHWYGLAAGQGYSFRPFLGDEAGMGLRELASEPRTGTATGNGSEWEDSILDGGAKSMLRLALQYQYGLCAPMDYDKAMRWEIRAAETGDAEAIAIVAESFRFAYNAYPFDPAAADRWEAVEPVSPPAPPSPLDIAKSLLTPANRPQPLAEYARQIHEEGRMHYFGEWARKDYYLAGLRFVEAAAFSVDVADNYFLLGTIQEKGLCGMANPYGAGKHYRIAAEMGHREACFRLGLLHETGNGVRQSLAQAEELYLRAGDTPGAAERLREVRALQRPGRLEEWEKSPSFRKVMVEAQFRAAFNHTEFRLPEEMRRARGWLVRCAGNGFPPAQYLTGMLYLLGDAAAGYDADPVKAKAWLEKAKAGGIKEAEEELRRLQ